MTMTLEHRDDEPAIDETIERGPEDDPIELGAEYNERDVADEVIERLGAEPNLYKRGGSLARVLVNRPSPDVLLRSPWTPQIVPLTRATLREVISAHVAFTTHDRPTRVPDWLVRAIFDRAGDWDGIRPLSAVVDTPVLRADGSIIERPGYDAATELYAMTAIRSAAMPASPTHDDAVRARDALLEVVCNFPFEREEHRAAAVAGMLTPLARYAFVGPAPLIAIDKNVRGAGGTLLADAIGMIVSGRPMPRMIAAKDAEEERKRITSIAMTGVRSS